MAVALALTPVVPAMVAADCTAALPSKTSCIGNACGFVNSVEGPKLVHPGDLLDAGYKFKFSNTTGAPVTVTVSGRVVYPVLCPDKTYDYLVVPLNNNTSGLPSPTTGGYGDVLPLAPVMMYPGLNCDNTNSPDGLGDGECTYTLPAGFSGSAPTGVAATYQSGVWMVPNDLCGGQTGSLAAGTVFSGTITTNDAKDLYVFQFHYAATDPQHRAVLLTASYKGTFIPGSCPCQGFDFSKNCGNCSFDPATNTVTFPVFGAITETCGSDSGFTISDNPPLDTPPGAICYQPNVGGNASLPCVDVPQPSPVACDSVTLSAGKTLCYQGTWTSSTQNGGSDTITVTDVGGTMHQAIASCAPCTCPQGLHVTKSCSVSLVPDPDNLGQIVVKVGETGTITNTTSPPDTLNDVSLFDCVPCIAPATCSATCPSGNKCPAGQNCTDIPLSMTTLGPGASEVYTNTYLPSVLGTCKGAPATSCTTNADCGPGGTCVPFDLTDTVRATATVPFLSSTCASTFSASATCSICPTCPNCPFNVQQ